MSIQPLKEKLIPLLVVIASVGGTLAVFGSVPVIARLASIKQVSPPPYIENGHQAEATPVNWL